MTTPAAGTPVRTRAPMPGDEPRSDARGRDRAVLALLVVVATVLRLYDLNSQLWLDEIAAWMSSMRRPAAEIATQWPTMVSHVFYDLLAHASTVVLGNSSWALRLPAAAFGILGVVVLYLLAVRVFGRGFAAFVGALFAVSYHDIFYSQNARGYTAFILFFLVTSYLLLTFWDERRITPLGGVAYAAAGSLAVYSVLFGVFIVPAHALVVLGAHALARRRGERPAVPLARYLACAGASLALMALLYAPLVRSVVLYTELYPKRAAGVGPPHPVVAPSLTVVLEAAKGLSAAFMGPVGLAVVAVVGLVGVLGWYRRDARSLAVLLAPLALEGIGLLAIGTRINPRFFAIALPIAILAGAYGVFTIVRAAAGRLAGARARRAVGAALALVVLASMLPLVRYYRVPKQDYLGAVRAVDALAAPGDERAAVYLAARGINLYYRAGFLDVETLDDLTRIERPGKRLWLVTTLERQLYDKDAALYKHIKDGYRLVRVLPATIWDAEMRIYLRSPDAAPSRG